MAEYCEQIMELMLWHFELSTNHKFVLSLQFSRVDLFVPHSWNLWIHIPIDCSGWKSIRLLHMLFSISLDFLNSTILSHIPYVSVSVRLGTGTSENVNQFRLPTVFVAWVLKWTAKNCKTLYIPTPLSDIQTDDLKGISIDWTFWHRDKFQCARKLIYQAHPRDFCDKFQKHFWLNA